MTSDYGSSQRAAPLMILRSPRARVRRRRTRSGTGDRADAHCRRPRNQINAMPRDKVQDGGTLTWPLDPDAGQLQLQRARRHAERHGLRARGAHAVDISTMPSGRRSGTRTISRPSRR